MRPDARRFHSRRDGLRTVERPADVDVEDVLPLVRRDLLERAPNLAEHAAGVVHEHVDAARRGAGFVYEGIDRALVADVHDARRAHAVMSADEPLRLRQLVFENVAGPHAAAAPCEREADRAAESVRRAGDDDRFSR